MSEPGYSLSGVIQRLDSPTQGVGSTVGLIPIPETTEQLTLHRASQAFESIFLGKLLSSMRSTVPENGYFGGNSPALKIFRAMQDEETAKSMAASGGIGLAALLYNQMVKTLPSHITGGPADIPFPEKFGVETSPEDYIPLRIKELQVRM